VKHRVFASSKCAALLQMRYPYDEGVNLALVFLLFVFFIVIAAIVLWAFPPEKIVAWMARGKKN
jgi:hypothetical protein